jgi:secreted trypsin-like serine protease
MLAGCSKELAPLPTQPAPIPAATACEVLGATTGISILNGATCDPGRSAVVRLNMRRADNSALGGCTGTIVAPRTVLTAAHCLDEDVRIVRVWLGSGPEIEAESFTFFPNYQFNSPSSFDVGVVRLGQDLPRAPMSILTSRDAQVGETAILAGWGRDQNNESTQLRAGSTTISSVTATLLQTIFAPPSASVCSGDSGGPILLNQGGTWAIAGITSATSANVCNTGNNFYQSIRHPAMTSFILEHVPGIGQR